MNATLQEFENSIGGAPAWMQRSRNTTAFALPDLSGESRPGWTRSRSVFLPASVVAKALETPVLGNLLAVGAGYPSYAPGETCQKNMPADQMFLVYCQTGLGWCETGGRRFNLEPGDVLVIPAGGSCVFGAGSGEDLCTNWVQVAGTRRGFYESRLGAGPGRPVIKGAEDNETGVQFEELFDSLTAGHAPSQILRTTQMLSRMLERLGWQQRSLEYGEADAARKIRQSIDFMRQRLDQPMQVAALAARVNISQSHYFAVFKRITGCTPIDYFIHLRMQKACQLLNTTAATVKGVAAALGYEDPFYFSRLFRSVHGIAPSEYRLLSSEIGAATGGAGI